MELEMGLERIARILYNMSLDMDYADSLEYAEEEIECITKELQVLSENKCDSLMQVLEVIAGKNEDMEHWKDEISQE